ncbi:MAG: hypothetical protein ACC649_05080 [Myxococcota bacterium]
MSAKLSPAERDRFWLDHEAAIKVSGTTAKAYASEQGLSLHALYQARKRLRALGLIATTALSQRGVFAGFSLRSPRRTGVRLRHPPVRGRRIHRTLDRLDGIGSNREENGAGYAIYIRENLRAESSSESAFDTDQVALRVSRREDGILTQAGRKLHFPAV